MSYTDFDFPHTHFFEEDLREILKRIFELTKEVEDFVSLNSIKYADPIQWDITRQYEKNTVVIDPLTGIAYLSVQPVPSGASIYNTDYWTEVFNLERFLTGANSNFTTKIDNNTLTATFATSEGEWLIWNDLLYVATRNISVGDQYVDGSNLARVTMYSTYVALLNSIATNYNEMLNNDKALAGDFAVRQEYDTTTATYNLNAGQWVVIDYVLYSATSDISVGDTYQEGVNISRVTVETIYNSILTTIAALTQRVTNLEMGNVIMIGDSYALGVTNGGQDPNITSWCEYLRTLLGKTNDQVFIRGQNSGAFAASADILRFSKIIEDEEANIDAKFSRYTVSHIIVCAGANEILYNYADVLNGVVEFCNYCKTRYPNAKVYIGMIGYGPQGIINGINTLYGYHDISLCGYIDGARSCSNAVYLNGIENQHKEYYRGYHTGSDGVHPNAFGYLSLAQGIKQAVISGSCDIHSIAENLAVTPETGVTINRNNMLAIVDNDVTTWKHTGDMVISGLTVDNYVANGTVPILIGTVTNGGIIGRADDAMCPITIFYYDSSQVLHTAQGLLYVDTSKLYITIKEANTAAWVATSVRSIYIPAFEFKFVTTMC